MHALESISIVFSLIFFYFRTAILYRFYFRCVGKLYEWSFLSSFHFFFQIAWIFIGNFWQWILTTKFRNRIFFLILEFRGWKLGKKFLALKNYGGKIWVTFGGTKANEDGVFLCAWLESKFYCLGRNFRSTVYEVVLGIEFWTLMNACMTPVWVKKLVGSSWHSQAREIPSVVALYYREEGINPSSHSSPFLFLPCFFFYFHRIVTKKSATVSIHLKRALYNTAFQCLMNSMNA